MASITEPVTATRNGATIPVENPATGEVIGEIPVMGAAEIQRSSPRAPARPSRAGRRLGFDGRAKVLRRAQKWMLDNAERIIARRRVREPARPTRTPSWPTSATRSRPWASGPRRRPSIWPTSACRRGTTRWPSGKKLVIRYAPVGVVGVIGPWNYPITNNFGDCIPALAAGNSVILKPSEVTPLSSLLMEQMMRECGLPEGVFQVATGDGSTGAALIAHVDCLMFTGSSATGKAVMKAAADALIPCYLELGGKDPMIVCADANLQRAANAAAFYSMNNAGQVCISIERVYVEEPVYDRFVELVTQEVRGLRQGAPQGPGTVDVGAVTFPPQLDIVSEHVDDAVAKGARILTGGHARSDRGRFFEPTVLVDVDHSMKIMSAGDLRPDAADHEGRRLRGGACAWPTTAPTGCRPACGPRTSRAARRWPAASRPAWSASTTPRSTTPRSTSPWGAGRPRAWARVTAPSGIRKYTKTQSLLVTRRALKREPFMFPYKAARTMLLRRVFGWLYGRGAR